ncbi:MAG TPA: ABC transporter permease [Candidatus Limnocylindrales bacterium]|nr:ABC transporter permease [Candidatus Limnocylindrales bacterium]
MIRFSGRLRSSLIVGLQGIRARKLRTLLSMLSLFLGVLAVVVVQAGAETAQRAAVDNIELIEGKDGTLRLFMPSEPRIVPMALETAKLRPDAVVSTTTQAVIGEPGVVPVNPGGSPFDQNWGGDWGGGPGFRVQCDESGCRKVEEGPQMPRGQAIELMLTALSADIRQFKPFRPEAGQWLDFTSPPSLAPRIVLNREAAKGFSKHRVPAEMRIDGAKANMTPQIIGVIDDGQGQPTAYVRFDELQNWMDASAIAQRSGIEMMLSPQASDLITIMRSKLVGIGLPEDSLNAQPVRSMQQVESQLALIRWLFLGMASLVLLIGVAGILNVGLATVGERIEEFALRRAVGTPRMLLAGIVLAETMLTGLLTAGAAIGVAAVALDQAGRFVPDSFPRTLQALEFPWQAAVAGIIAGLVAGLLGGLIPAVRAARIPIATVMRA